MNNKKNELLYMYDVTVLLYIHTYSTVMHNPIKLFDMHCIILLVIDIYA